MFDPLLARLPDSPHLIAPARWASAWCEPNRSGLRDSSCRTPWRTTKDSVRNARPGAPFGPIVAPKATALLNFAKGPQPGLPRDRGVRTIHWTEI